MPTKEDCMKAAEFVKSASALAAEGAGMTIVNHPKFELHHMKLDQDEKLVKLVFHFHKIAMTTMAEMGEKLNRLVKHLDPPYPSRAIAGKSPLADVNLEHRSRWDFILMNVPRLHADPIYNAILKSITEYK
jgi:hypothetical protein